MKPFLFIAVTKIVKFKAKYKCAQRNNRKLFSNNYIQSQVRHKCVITIASLAFKSLVDFNIKIN